PATVNYYGSTCANCGGWAAAAAVTTAAVTGAAVASANANAANANANAAAASANAYNAGYNAGATTSHATTAATYSVGQLVEALLLVHALFERASGLTEAIIAAAIEKKLRACRSQGRGESPSDPQGATLELHEAAERSCRTTDQLPRDEGHRWYPPVDSIWCEQMSELIQRERTGFMCLSFLCDLLFRIVVFQISRSPHCFD